ncbi:MAG: Rho termination factor N-terminal domain-containing protein, partial [Dermatophilus congolensis]|nr:Rho termination factor N-terminal domain-containing protein [Dermatophilus congolensis]
MTDTTEAGVGTAPKRRGLTTMRLAELQQLAGTLGIPGTSQMRKGDLITAIREVEGAGRPAARRAASRPASRPAAAQAPAESAGSDGSAETPRENAQSGGSARRSDDARDGGDASQRSEQSQRPEQAERSERTRTQRAPRSEDTATSDGASSSGSGQSDSSHSSGGSNGSEQGGRDQRESRSDGDSGQQRDHRSRDNGTRSSGEHREGQGTRDQRDDNNRSRDGRPARRDQRDNRDGGQRDRQNMRDNRDNRSNRRNDDDDPRGRRRSRNRSRDRRRGRDDFGGNEVEVYTEDDVLVPVAGILDVLDNYAFVRTSGYLPGPGDVYVPLGMVKKHGLRKGDAVTGAVKALREGEQPPARQKFNALVRLDTVNGGSPDDAKNRVEFNKLTPLYPQERLRLETEPNIYTTRIIDLVSPIGKGQRGLIVSPPKAGKTLILQAIANAITKNNPEAHLMVVLVDERPEEVTDMQRTVKGEVIATTFDRPADDHTTV